MEPLPDKDPRHYVVLCYRGVIGHYRLYRVYIKSGRTPWVSWGLRQALDTMQDSSLMPLTKARNGCAAKNHEAKSNEKYETCAWDTAKLLIMAQILADGV